MDFYVGTPQPYGRSWENCLRVLSCPNSGKSSVSEVARPSVLTHKKVSNNGLDVLRPCMGLSVHVPNGYLTVVFN